MFIGSCRPLLISVLYITVTDYLDIFTLYCGYYNINCDIPSSHTRSASRIFNSYVYDIHVRQVAGLETLFNVAMVLRRGRFKTQCHMQLL